MELLAGDRLGKYEAVGRLAAGGMAEVYLARSIGHGGFAKTVALKRMLPDLACEPGFREMFMHEASLAARLNHPHIVQIFDFAEERGELYLAMEFVHGVNLRQLHHEALASSKGKPESPTRLSPVLAAHICRCIARALAYAWQVPDENGEPSHLIHRDVSPHNVLLSYEGDVKLADFGIAKPAERRTSVGVLKGKLLYMAPEQLLGGALDARTDVFALGIVLYETAMNLRKPLFEAGSEDAVKGAVQSRVVIPPCRMDPDFPKSIGDVIMKALERDPARRFQSASELADALGEAIHKESRGPHDTDLAAFMRRLYGEPPPIKGLRPLTGEVPRTPSSSTPISLVNAVPPSDPTPHTIAERRGGRVGEKSELVSDDPYAATVRRDAPPPTTQPGEVVRPSGSNGRRVMGVVAGVVLLGVAAAGVSWKWLATERVAGADAGVAQGVVAPASPDAAQVSQGPDARAAGTGPNARADAGQAEPASDARDAGEQSVPLDASTRMRDAGRTPPPPVVVNREPKGEGTLVVHVKPWAFVWVDNESYTGNRNQEAAPALRRVLPSGKHVVHIRDPKGNVTSTNVTVRAGREARIERTFTP